MRARLVAAGVVLLGAAAFGAWTLVADRRRAAESEEVGADATTSVAPRAATLAASGRAPKATVRRVTIRLVGGGQFVPAGTTAGISSPDGDRIDRERGAFVRRDDGATPAFVCDDPHLPPPGPRGIAALVVRPGFASLRVPLDIPRSSVGGWADEFDVTATVSLDALATVVGRVRSSSGPGVPDLRVVLLGPRPMPTLAPPPTAPARRGGPPPPPLPAFLAPDPQADDWASDRLLLGFSETDAEGRFSMATIVAVGLTIDARVVVTLPRTAVAQESHLSAPVPLRAGERAAVPDLEVEEGAVVDGKILVSEHDPAWASVQGLTLAANAPSGHFAAPWLDGYVDESRISRTTVGDDNAFRLTGLTAGPCLLALAPPRGQPDTVIHPDVADACRRLVTAPATTVTLGIPSRSLTFRVEDDDGGVGQALLKIDGRVGYLTIETGADGYADAIVPTGQPLRLTVEAAGHATLTSTLDAATSSDPARLRLARDASVARVASEVLSEDGRRPMVQARLTVAGNDQMRVTVRCRVKDASGKAVPARFGRSIGTGVGGAASAVVSWHDVIPCSATLLEPSVPGRYTIEVVDEHFVAEPAEMIVRAAPPAAYTDGFVLLYCRLR